jgi:hypothetical protein
MEGQIWIDSGTRYIYDGSSKSLYTVLGLIYEVVM